MNQILFYYLRTLIKKQVSTHTATFTLRTKRIRHALARLLCQKFFEIKNSALTSLHRSFIGSDMISKNGLLDVNSG